MQMIIAKEEEAVQLAAFLNKSGVEATRERHADCTVFVLPEENKALDAYIDSLTKFVIHIKRYEFLNKILIEKFHYENPYERQQIIEVVTEMCSGKRHELTALTGRINEYEIVKEAIISSLSSEPPLMFESLLTFRLKEYRIALKRFLHVAIDEYRMEQEYQVFVHTLRDYLHRSRAKKRSLHLAVEEEVSFYDEKFNRMNKEKVMEMVDRRLIANHPLYIDSGVIAPLLSIAPERIYIYTESEEKPLVRTLINIFEERVSVRPLAELQGTSSS